MNRIAYLVAGLFSVSASSAFAADMVYRQPAPEAPYVDTYSWTGGYVGAQVGYGWTEVEFLGGLATEDFDGLNLGAHAGYNFQHGNFVFGVEGDVNYTFNENTYLGGLVEAGTDWTGSLRARVGYAIDRTLIYGTGGLALANAYIDTPVGDLSETLTGWTIGAGVEHAFTNNWTARIEYRYTDYGREDFGLGAGDFDFKDHSVRIGVSYKF